MVGSSVLICRLYTVPLFGIKLSSVLYLTSHNKGNWQTVQIKIKGCDMVSSPFALNTGISIKHGNNK